MSTPTTARGALLRRAGILLVAGALVTTPATSALADPTVDATPTSTAATTPGASGTPSPSVSGTVEPTATATPTGTTPAPTGTAPAPSSSPTASTPAPATSSPKPSTGAPTGELLRGASASVLAKAAAEPVAQTAYAADFLARALSARAHHFDYPGGDWFDGGNTIDAIIALAASGSGSAEAGRALDYLVANLNGSDVDSYDGVGGEKYAGPTAKALLGVVVAGANPRDLDGLDLVSALKALETPSGRFSDVSVYGDNSNTIGQALAVLALVRAGESVSSAAVDLLKAQQCPDGGFRGAIGDSTCSSDSDATGFAAQALIAVGATTEADAALDHLADLQLGSGGLVSDDGVANANTTAVAAQAFAAGGRDAELAQARAFLVSLQYTCASPTVLRGGIAFSTAKRSTTTPSDEDLRATPQATLALSGESLLSVAWPEGAATGTTALPCTTTPTRTPTATVDATAGAGTGQGGGSEPSVTVDSATAGSLAQTGTDLLAPALLGLLLVVVGGVAVYSSNRRRGAHA